MTEKRHPDYRWFGGRLRELRGEAGWSRRELEIASGVPQATITDLEIGRRYPGWDTVLRLADALAVSIDEFKKPPKPTSIRPIAGRPRRKSVGKSAKREIIIPEDES